MADTSTTVEICKLAVSLFLRLKDAIVSIGFMLFLVVFAGIGAHVPLAWWNKKFPTVGKLCQAHHEVISITFWLALIAMIMLFCRDIFHKLRAESDFAKLMESLTPVEMKALCNAYHKGGKHLLPSCVAELDSLKEKGLIVVSSESDTFGGREFTLSSKTYEYIKKHTDFFEKRGIKPGPPEKDKVPFFAVV